MAEFEFGGEIACSPEQFRAARMWDGRVLNVWCHARYDTTRAAHHYGQSRNGLARAAVQPPASRC